MVIALSKNQPIQNIIYRVYILVSNIKHVYNCNADYTYLIINCMYIDLEINLNIHQQIIWLNRSKITLIHSNLCSLVTYNG